MDSIFVTHGAADAVPIWFVTAANYPDVRKMIGAEARAFADAAGFEPKSGRYLLLPGKTTTRPASAACCSASKAQTRSRIRSCPAA